MAGIGAGELIWLLVAVFLALGVVFTWIMKAEASRNVFRQEVNRLKSQLDEMEREKLAMIEEVEAFKGTMDSTPVGMGQPAAGAGNAMAAKMAEKVGELEKDNDKLKKELSEARSSLEEVYKALCSK